jgi:hypothetical protein
MLKDCLVATLVVWVVVSIVLIMLQQHSFFESEDNRLINSTRKTVTAFRTDIPLLDFSHEYPTEFFNIQKGLFVDAHSREIIFAVEHHGGAQKPNEVPGELFPSMLGNESSAIGGGQRNYYCRAPPGSTSHLWLRFHVSIV